MPPLLAISGTRSFLTRFSLGASRLTTTQKRSGTKREKKVFFSRTSFFCGKWVDLALKFTPRFGKEAMAAAAVWVVYERRLYVVFGVWKGGITSTYGISLIVAHKCIFFEMHLNLAQDLLATLVRKRKKRKKKCFPSSPPSPRKFVVWHPFPVFFLFSFHRRQRFPIYFFHGTCVGNGKRENGTRATTTTTIDFLIRSCYLKDKGGKEDCT